MLTTQPPNHPTPDPSPHPQAELGDRWRRGGGTTTEERREVNSREGRRWRTQERKGRTPNWRCEPPPKGSVGKSPLQEEEVGGGHHQRRRREERRSEPPSYGAVEGIHFNVLSFHYQKEERRRHPKKAEEGSTTGGDRSDGEKAPPPTRRRWRSSHLLCGGAPFLLLLRVGVLLACPLWVVLFLFEISIWKHSKTCDV